MRAGHGGLQNERFDDTQRGGGIGRIGQGQERIRAMRAPEHARMLAVEPDGRAPLMTKDARPSDVAHN